MKKKNSLRTLCPILVRVALILNAEAYAHADATHQAFSQVAAHNSVLAGSTSILADLNLPALSVGTDYLSSTGAPGSALTLISFGALYEDDAWGWRALNHSMTRNMPTSPAAL